MLSGKRILIVEDEPMIALDIEAAVKDAGAIVIGPAATLDVAQSLAQSSGLDGAILDLRLGTDSSADLVTMLRAQGIPCVVHTADSQFAEQWPAVPVFDKPVLPEALIAALAGLLGTSV